MEKKHYNGINALRTIGCIGIVMMHMVANNNYMINGFIYKKIIPSFTDFVFIFMIVSAFGMCCGYYDRVINNKLNLAKFYERRIKKIFPFFGILILIDVIVEHSLNSLYEGFADLTLLFGFIPRSLNVIGVGWFIGLIFIFYLIFPFFCLLIENKRRAWISFIISLLYNYISSSYFGLGRANILYSGCFFLAGGLIYLYKDELVKKYIYIYIILFIISIVLYYQISSVYSALLVSILMLIIAIISHDKILDNKVTKFFSDISMEIYLSHMLIFRAIQKLKINVIFGNGWFQYIITVGIVIAGASVFSLLVKQIIRIIEKRVAINTSIS